jgi:prepilin-type N-terminal cleavage/methylation domain-containing protein
MNSRCERAGRRLEFRVYAVFAPRRLKAGLQTRVFKQALGSRGQAAFTLVELMVASALALVLATAIATFAFFSSRSFVVMANYTEMNQRSQLALDRMSKDIRQARLLGAYSTNSLTFSNADGTPLQFTYTPGTRKLVRVSGGTTTTLLSDCDSLQFWIYQHTMKSNTFDCYLPAVVTNARVIQVTWKNSRQILGKKATTENVESSKITLRNR